MIKFADVTEENGKELLIRSRKFNVSLVFIL